ncbi:MAG: hypothetical protein PHO90_01565 [Candidatus Pacebacteria bacterium]|nr:hypothetical protein [Candidatus Paceibacterota bacterium]
MVSIADYDHTVGTSIEKMLKDFPGQAKKQTEAIGLILCWTAEKVVLNPGDTVLKGISEHDCGYILAALRNKDHTRAEAIVRSITQKLRKQNEALTGLLLFDENRIR